MPIDPVDLLLDTLTERGGKWPPPREVHVRRTIATYRAFLESDREALKVAAGWSTGRDYKLDPLPELIADAWADHIFGQDLTVAPANDADSGLLDAIIEGNGDLATDLHAAERRTVGEGEQWWRIFRDEDVADVPLVEWHSRHDVIPLYVGHRLIAAALVSELDRVKGARAAVWRHMEVYVDGAVEHVLWRGSPTRIGRTVPMETHPDLVELAASLGAANGEGQRWQHGLPMLMGKVTNGRGLDRRLRIGVSDFARIEDYLLDLNEAVTIGAENARLTAKRRMIVGEDAVRTTMPELVDRGDGTFNLAPRASVDLGEDVLVVSRLDAALGEAADAPYKVLEYSFDAAALIAYKRDLIESALTRVGLTPRYVGVSTGEAPGVLSGTAYRLTLIPTTKAGAGKARPWDDTLPHVLGLMARLDALPYDDGGFGRGWSDKVLDAPSVERGSSLPRDEVEEAQVDATLVQARLRSRETSIKRQHPDWSDELVDEELARIDEESPAATSAAGAAGAFLA